MRKMQALAIFLVLFSSILVRDCQAETTLWQAWILISDAATVALAWDPVQDAVRYDVKMQALYPTQEWQQTVTATTAVFAKKRTGFTRFFVRACPSPAGDDEGCSEWTASDGPNGTIIKPDGSSIAQPWGMFLRPSAPVIK